MTNAEPGVLAGGGASRAQQQEDELLLSVRRMYQSFGRPGWENVREHPDSVWGSLSLRDVTWGPRDAFEAFDHLVVRYVQYSSALRGTRLTDHFAGDAGRLRAALRDLRARSELRILDLCGGTGQAAFALCEALELGGVKITVADQDRCLRYFAEALVWARQNGIQPFSQYEVAHVPIDLHRFEEWTRRDYDIVLHFHVFRALFDRTGGGLGSDLERREAYAKWLARFAGDLLFNEVRPDTGRGREAATVRRWPSVLRNLLVRSGRTARFPCPSSGVCPLATDSRYEDCRTLIYSDHPRNPGDREYHWLLLSARTAPAARPNRLQGGPGGTLVSAGPRCERRYCVQS